MYCSTKPNCVNAAYPNFPTGEFGRAGRDPIDAWWDCTGETRMAFGVVSSFGWTGDGLGARRRFRNSLSLSCWLTSLFGLRSIPAVVLNLYASSGLLRHGRGRY